MTRVVLHIDRLVLRGVARGDAPAFQEAVKSSLEEHLKGQGNTTIWSNAMQGRHNALKVETPIGSDAFELGRAVGTAIGSGEPS